MPPVLRRTLSAPAARVSAAPYARRSGITQRRVLGDLAGEQLIKAARRHQNIPQPIAEEVSQAEVVMQAVREPVVEDVPLAPMAPAVPALVTGLAAMSLAPQTPTRRRTLRREPSLSPSLSDISVMSSRRSSIAPLDAPDFGTPESSPRRTRSRRARALQRTLSEPLIPSTPSRRRRLARTSSMDTISDENAPIAVRDIFN